MLEMSSFFLCQSWSGQIQESKSALNVHVEVNNQIPVLLKNHCSLNFGITDTLLVHMECRLYRHTKNSV
jgi:hypothetical protein